MLCNSNGDTISVIDDKCLTPLCKNVQLPFVQHTERIKHVGLILDVLCQFPVCVAYVFYRTDLPSVLLAEQEIYDQSCTLMKNVYIHQKPVHAP